MRPKMLAVVGWSGAGKTTLVKRLVRTLKQRGYRVGTIKHAHEGFEMDRPGSDTHQHLAAGAEAVMAVGPAQVALIRRMDVDDPETLAGWFAGFDLVIVEGFKNSRLSKIEVHRKANLKRVLNIRTGERLAFASDAAPIPETACFDLDAVDALADFVESRFNLRRGSEASAT